MSEELKPVIVLTQTLAEFEKYCTETGRNRETAIQVTHPSQFEHYKDLEVVLYGNYGFNNAYNSKEYRDYEYNKALEESKNL